MLGNGGTFGDALMEVQTNSANNNEDDDGCSEENEAKWNHRNRCPREAVLYFCAIIVTNTLQNLLIIDTESFISILFLYNGRVQWRLKNMWIMPFSSHIYPRAKKQK